MKNKLEYFLFVLFSKIFLLLGLDISRKTSTLIAFIFFYFIPIRKKIVKGNLSIAFPQLNHSLIKKLAFKVYKSAAIFLIELLYLPKTNPQQILDVVEYENKDLMHKRYNEGKGVIILSAHFGNWELIPTTMPAKLGLPMSTIVKPLRNPYVDKWINDLRTTFNGEVVPLGISIRKTYQALKEKKIIGIAADQRGPKEGVKVKFFGTEIPVYSGPAVLSLKTGAPILFLITVRQKNYKYKIEVKEIDQNDLPANEEERIIELTQRHTSYLEEMIREYPEQWFWMHKKWKRFGVA
jgi:KDO2-lipid IV(A) lauroyltransferase